MSHRNRLPFASPSSRRGFLVGSAALAIGARIEGAAQTATPEDLGSDALPPFSDRIGSLFAMSPARELTSEAPIAFYYADLARQMTSVGIELPDPNVAPDELPKGFVEASLALPLAAEPFRNGLMPEWFETFGFNPFGASQAITLNDPPNVVSIFAAEFDDEAVEATLESSGYFQILQETGGDYWTVGDELDLDSAVGRLGVGTMNHAAIYRDALVFAQREAATQNVAHTAPGLAPSLLEQGVWPSMAELFSPDTVGLIPVSPAAIVTGSAPEVGGMATPQPSADVEIEYLAFGVRAGTVSELLPLVGQGTPAATPESEVAGVPAQIEARIHYGEAADREAEAIPERWAELSSPFGGQPYTELMELEDAHVHDEDSAVVAIDFVTDVPNRWIQLVQTRDLAPFLPVG